MSTAHRLFGYARVSTSAQELAMQLDALQGAGCDPIYVEKASGARRDRPELDRLLAELQPGDVVVVYKLDRLARSLSHLAEMLDDWCKRGIVLRSLDGLDSSTDMGEAMCKMAGVFAEVERKLIRERAMAGQRAAKNRGKHIGRKPTDENKLRAAAHLLEGDDHLSVTEAARVVGISRQTLWRWTTNRHILQREAASKKAR